MTTPNTAHVRETCRQIDTELYLPVGSQLLAGTQVVTVAQLAYVATLANEFTPTRAFRGNSAPA